MDFYNLFKNKVVDFNRLIDFGFKKIDNNYVYSTKLQNSEFELTVIINSTGQIKTRLVDCVFNEEYTLHLADFADGEFVTKIKQKFYEILEQISNSCYKREVFVTPLAKQIENFVYKQFGAVLEFLWEDDNAIIRRKDNKKWYAVFMKIAKNKLNANFKDQIVEVVNVKLPKENIINIVDNKFYFKAYHMNKTYWLTILLNDNQEINKVLDYIQTSYELVSNKKHC